MSLTTLANLKSTLGIPDSDTSDDAALKHFLRRASARIRSHCKRFIGGVIDSVSVANPTVATSYGHGLRTGNVIDISGSNSTPTIDGERTVTVLSPDTFSIPVNVTAIGSGMAGFYGKVVTEFHGGNGTRFLPLRERPVRSIRNVWLDDEAFYGAGDDAFDDDTLLDESSYGLEFSEPGLSLTGTVIRTDGVWTNRSARSAGIQQSYPADGLGNLKVEMLVGYLEMPLDVCLAVEQFVAELMQTAARGGAMQSESLDYYAYTKVTPEQEAQAFSSVRGYLKKYTTAVV